MKDMKRVFLLRAALLMMCVLCAGREVFAQGTTGDDDSVPAAEHAFDDDDLNDLFGEKIDDSVASEAKSESSGDEASRPDSAGDWNEANDDDAAVETVADNKDAESNPPNFWSFVENLVPESLLPSADNRSPLARNVVPNISPADGHDDWHKRSDSDHFVDDSGLMNFLDGDDDAAAAAAAGVETSNDGKSAEAADSNDAESDTKLRSDMLPSVSKDEEDYDVVFRCSSTQNLVFDTATNPAHLYFSDAGRRNRMDFLIYKIAGLDTCSFNFRRDVAVRWVYTSPDGEQCELPEPGTEDEFLLTTSGTCDVGRDWEINSFPVPEKNALGTSLRLEDEDLLNFLPGTFGVRFYFRCNHGSDVDDLNVVHTWTSAQQIQLEYRRPSKPWMFRMASPEVTIALAILVIGLLSGLLAVFLWQKMAPPGAEGFEYSKLPEKMVKTAKPTWV